METIQTETVTEIQFIYIQIYWDYSSNDASGVLHLRLIYLTFFLLVSVTKIATIVPEIFDFVSRA